MKLEIEPGYHGFMQFEASDANSVGLSATVRRSVDGNYKGMDVCLMFHYPNSNVNVIMSPKLLLQCAEQYKEFAQEYGNELDMERKR